MNKLHLNNVNSGSYYKDMPICDRLAKFNNCLVKITQEALSIYDKEGNTLFACGLVKTEEDFMSITFEGQYENGQPFRIVRPGGRFSMGNNLIFGGMSGDEYAVQFSLVDENASDKLHYDNNSTYSVAESKAEILVLTADQCKISKPDMARDYIKRFLKMITEINHEFIKFEHIHNIVYGIKLAVGLSIINENDGLSLLKSFKLSFLSHEQSRYEGDIITMNVNALRSIEVIPNFKLNEGYLVAVFNHDGGGRNLQMAPKQMITKSKTECIIKLQGWGEDTHGVSFADYALSLHFSNCEVELAEIFMLDRNIRIEYR